jgi:fumarate reductase subunit C
VSVWWWLQKPSYALFVLRELTSVFVAVFAGVLLWQLQALAQGPEAYARFLDRLRTPPALALHAVALVFVLYHTVTWFHLSPRAMVLRLRGRRVPDPLIVGASYAAWLVLSAAVGLILVRG